MTEIQGKSILVRVSARFELARVRVIGSQLYISEFTQQDGGKKRTAKQLCVTNVTGLSLVGFVVIFT